MEAVWAWPVIGTLGVLLLVTIIRSMREPSLRRGPQESRSAFARRKRRLWARRMHDKLL